MDAKTKYRPRNAIKIVLFLSNWLFVVFLSKRVISPPQGEIDFLVKNLGSFFLALIITGVTLCYFPGRVLKISIIVVWTVTILLAIY
jgi:hypothetical protein